mgnify:FL=1
MTFSGTLRRSLFVLAIGLLMSLLAACGSDEEPLRVYITPTPETSGQQPPQSTGGLVPVSDQGPRERPDWGAVSTPTPGSFGPIITAAPASETAPPATATTAPTTPPPTATDTPQPTDTATPTVAASPTPTLTLTPTVEGTPLPTYNAELMGIQINANMSAEDFATMLWLTQRLGVRWVKFQMAWEDMEPERGQFSDVFYRYRVFVQDANAAGFHVLLSIAKAPAWARATAEEDGPPANPQDLANFITTLMSEVRVDIEGRSYFDAIEVWNEPNLRREWNGAELSGAAYMRLFDAAYNAIRNGEGGHSVTIVSAGLAPTGINDGVNAVDDRTYLRQMLAAGLADPKYQNIAVGVHPYGAANPPDARCCASSAQGYDNDPTWFFLNTLEDYHAIIQSSGNPNLQLWATEFGWGTYEGFVNPEGTPVPPPADPPYFTWIDQEQQAHFILRAFEIGQSLPYLGPMFLWNLNFSASESIEQGDPQAAYALLLPNVTDPLRPAFKLLEAAPKIGGVQP